MCVLLLVLVKQLTSTGSSTHTGIAHPSYTDYGKDYGKSVTVHQNGGTRTLVKSGHDFYQIIQSFSVFPYITVLLHGHKH